jgi:hypothetical protein
MHFSSTQTQFMSARTFGPSAQMHGSVRANARPGPHGWQQILRELHKGFLNTPSLLPSWPLSEETMMYLLHLVVQAAIKESSFVHTCHCIAEQFCRSLWLGWIWRPWWQGALLAIGHLSLWMDLRIRWHTGFVEPHSQRRMEECWVTLYISVAIEKETLVLNSART